MKKLKIVSMSKYLPQKIESKKLEEEFGIPLGWSEKYSGVKTKH